MSKKEKWDGITKMLDETVRKISPKDIRTEVKKHRIYDKETNTKDDVYDRGIYALDINSCLEVRKGLDFFDPIAIPRRALIDVLECPTPKTSYSLSSRFGNGASPSL